jgi:hypothetical protein
MLDSPQTITINSVDIDCNKTQDEKTSSLYASDDGTLEFRVSHQAVKNRTRRMARIDQTKIAADPLTAINAYQKAGVYIVIDEPEVGFSNTEIDYLVDALSAWLTSANITAMLAGRH